MTSARRWFVSLACLGAVAAGCADPASPAQGRVVGEGAVRVVAPDGASLVGREVVIMSPDGEVARGTLSSVWRPRVRDDVLDLLGLPVGWREVSVDGVAAVASGSAPAVAPRPASGGTGRGLVLLYALAALYAVLTIGVSGGPNHGEHPLLVCTLHGVVFLLGCHHWSPAAYWPALGLVVAAWCVAVYALRLVGEAGRRLWLTRLVMAGLWSASLAVHLSEPEYQTRAAWTSPTAFELYVPPSRRGPLALVDAAGAPLGGAALDPGEGGRALWVWTGERAPAGVRLGDGELVPLGARPGR